MSSMNISEKSDEELQDHIEKVLRGELSLGLLRDETPSNRIFRLHQSQKEPKQRRRIENLVYNLLRDNFIRRVIDNLDKNADEFLGNLAFVAESLKIKKSYNVFRSLIDRGILGPGIRFFYKKDSERKILRTLMAFQSPELLVERVWKLYWGSQDPFFWDVAFLGIRKSDVELAISLLYEGYERWAKNNDDFDFPQSLWEIVNNTKDKKQLLRIGDILRDISPEHTYVLEATLKSKGISLNKLRLTLPLLKSVYTLNDTKISRERPFYVYHHRDIDGVGSAVLLWLFLTKKCKHDPKQIKTIPVDFDRLRRKFTIRQPAAIVDFRYHKDVLVYYDHHQYPFINAAFERDFAERRFKHKYLRLQRGGSSTIKLLFLDFKRFFQEEFSDRFEKLQEMVEQIDKIDSAQYKDGNGWVDCNFEFAKINLILYVNRTNAFCNKLIKDLVQTDCDKLLEREEYKKLFAQAKSKIESELERILSVLEPLDSVIFYDAVKHRVPFYRFFPYRPYRDAHFVVGIYERQKNSFEVSVGRNPWKKVDFEVDIGQLCKSFREVRGCLSAGGREDVGGITFSNYEQASRAARKIANILVESLEK